MRRIKRLLAVVLELAGIAVPLWYLDALPSPEAARWALGLPVVVGICVALFRMSGELKRSADDDWPRELTTPKNSDGEERR